MGSQGGPRVRIRLPPAESLRTSQRHTGQLPVNSLRDSRAAGRSAGEVGVRFDPARSALRLVHSAGVARIVLLIGRVRRLSRSSCHGGAPGERQDDEERGEPSRSASASVPPIRRTNQGAVAVVRNTVRLRQLSASRPLPRQRRGISTFACFISPLPSRRKPQGRSVAVWESRQQARH
jgi:hypothetical protein